MTTQDSRIEELLQLAEMSGPLPGDLEDELWVSTLALYRTLADGRADSEDSAYLDYDGDTAEAVVVDLVPTVRAADQPRRQSTKTLLAFAAAVLLIVGTVVAIAAISDRGTTNIDTAGPTDDWSLNLQSTTEQTRQELREADAIRIRTLPVGLAATTEYLDSAAEAVTELSLALDGAPDRYDEPAMNHARALSAWAEAARELVTDIVADPRDFANEDELARRLSEIAALEERALVTTCVPLRLALADSITCGLVTGQEPPS